MRKDLLLLASDLARRGEAFILATVVRREPPSSARVGDTALVTPGGAFHGWLGGSCTQPSVIRESLLALADGQPRLIALSPNPQSDLRPGVLPIRMTCHSGGSVDIYLEPQRPAPRLIVFGVSPVARALARLANVLGYDVDAVDPDADRAAFPEVDRVLTDRSPTAVRPPVGGRLSAVVATMGQWDEEATATALSLGADYVGVVASRKRWGEIRSVLTTVPAGALDRVACPAGLDLGAHSPEEIALSVLAQLVQLRATAAPAPAPGPVSPPAQVVDPVCGMTVDITTARHTTEFAGRTWYFCCPGCRGRFLREPERFLAAAQTGDGGAA
jgi:xanthine dehydrogenase accessory factor